MGRRNIQVSVWYSEEEERSSENTHLVVHHESHPPNHPLHRVDLRKLSNVSEVPDLGDIHSFSTLPFDVGSGGGGDSRAREEEELDEEGGEEESSNVVGLSDFGSLHSDIFEDGGKEA